MPDFEYTREPNTVSAALNGFDRLGIDTEFMRERTFFAELCLVQIATSERIYCVDPITTDATDEFWSRVHACNWVLHAGRQDLEVIYQATQQMPRSVFDNQVAAGLLGMPPQMGYAGLIKELFDVDIPKAHTRSNWAARPLPPEQLAYAAEDVEYLLPACDILAERLATKGRL